MYLTSFDKTKIFYKISKTKKPKGTILFIHGGFFGNHSLLKKIYSGFAKDYNLLLPDVRGKGDSGFPEKKQNITLEEYATDMYELLKKEKVKEVYIVGVSFGGLISLKLYELFNTKIKIKKLILISSSYTTMHAKNNVLISKILIPMLKGTVLVLDTVWPFKEKRRKDIDYSKMPKRNFHLFYAISLFKNNSLKTLLRRYKTGFNILEHEVNEDSIKKIKIPVLLIWGDKDILFGKRIQEKMIRLFEKSEIKVIKGGSHNIYIHDAKEVIGYIRSFLD
jgi:pimeloyl-ACP methyl ester carboxylesterase